MSLEVRFVFINSRLLGEQGSVERILEVLQRQGYTVIEPEVPTGGGSSAMWMESAYAEKSFRVGVLNGRYGLELYISGGWGERWLGREGRSWLSGITFQIGLFNWRANEPERYAAVLLDLTRHLYEAVSPAFGWLDISHSPVGHTEIEDVEALILTAPYWATFLGAPYTARYGAAELDARFSRQGIRLSDGGVLYVMSDRMDERG